MGHEELRWPRSDRFCSRRHGPVHKLSTCTDLGARALDAHLPRRACRSTTVLVFPPKKIYRVRPEFFSVGTKNPATRMPSLFGYTPQHFGSRLCKKPQLTPNKGSPDATESLSSSSQRRTDGDAEEVEVGVGNCFPGSGRGRKVDRKPGMSQRTVLVFRVRKRVLMQEP